MNKKAFGLLLVLVAILLLVAPVAADRPEPVGTRLNLFMPPATLLAEQPFHISHGWGFSPPQDRPGSGLGFVATVDGVPLEPDFVSRGANPGEGQILLAWQWVYNFPAGMTGTHTFAGEWFTSCGYAMDMGLFPGPCPKRNERFVVEARSATVTFLP